MAISSLKITTEVDGELTLPELLDLLGSPKKLKDALANLESETRKANKAMKELKSSQMKFQSESEAEAASRAKEMKAIAKDRDALKSAWDALELETASRDAENKAARAKLREDTEATIAVEKKQAAAEEYISNTRKQLAKDHDNAATMVADARSEASKDGAAAEKAKADAKNMLADANEKMAGMRALVG